MPMPETKPIIVSHPHLEHYKTSWSSNYEISGDRGFWKKNWRNTQKLIGEISKPLCYDTCINLGAPAITYKDDVGLDVNEKCYCEWMSTLHWRKNKAWTAVRVDPKKYWKPRTASS